MSSTRKCCLPQPPLPRFCGLRDGHRLLFVIDLSIRRKLANSCCAVAALFTQFLCWIKLDNKLSRSLLHSVAIALLSCACVLTCVDNAKLEEIHLSSSNQCNTANTLVLARRRQNGHFLGAASSHHWYGNWDRAKVSCSWLFRGTSLIGGPHFEPYNNTEVQFWLWARRNTVGPSKAELRCHSSSIFSLLE